MPEFATEGEIDPLTWKALAFNILFFQEDNIPEIGLIIMFISYVYSEVSFILLSVQKGGNIWMNEESRNVPTRRNRGTRAAFEDSDI